jgi:hypothetical protein
MPIRTLTVAPLANRRYAPDPLPGCGQPFAPYVVPPLAVLLPGVTVPSVHVPIAANGWSNSAWKCRVY